MKSVIVIPAYKPTQGLLDLVEKIDIKQPIVIINDGSGTDFDDIFHALKQKSNVKILKHAVNLGKGQALKTAFNFILNEYPDAIGVITADADGQHLPEDILKVKDKLMSAPHKLWLGAREFEGKIPFRSRFGNVLTRKIFWFFVGVNLVDTQTGLRGIPKSFLPNLLSASSNGYDFELDMLIQAAQQKIDIIETPITTVYEENNKSSHFNPIVDSFKIYFVFFRFLIFAILSGLFDFLAFSLVFFFSGHVFLSESIARVFSGTCNFLFNKEWVFQSNDRMLPEALKYTLLVMINLIFSYGFISSMVFLGANVYFSKLIALIGLFFANFAIQNLMVFGNNRHALKT